MKILALDLGKTKTVACEYEVTAAEARYTTIKTRRDAIHDLIVKYGPDRVVFEIGPAAGWLSDMVQELRLELEVANTSHPAWRWSNTKKKTDRSDALRLAQLSALRQLPQVRVPGRETRQWRSFIRYRHHLVRRRTGIKNRIRAILEREGESLLEGRRGWNAASIAMLKVMARPVDGIGRNDLWRGELSLEMDSLHNVEELLKTIESKLDQFTTSDTRCCLVQTIPGVGPRLAEIVVAILDDPHRFKNRKQVASYVGLSPRIYQSGNSDRQGRISGQGNTLLRMMLVEIAWIGLRYNPWMKEVYEQVRKGSSSRKKIAIVAVARRLLVRCWAILRDGTPWRPPRLSCAT